MKKMLAVICGLLLSGGISFAATLTFDEVDLSQGMVKIPNEYGGLNWENFWFLRQDPGAPDTGLYNGMVSPYNMVVNDYYYDINFPARITAPLGTTFTLNSAFLTACWWYDVLVEVRGYLGGKLMFDLAFNLTPDAPLLAEFGSVPVDCVTFTVSHEVVDPEGNHYSEFSGQFVIDNLTVNTPIDTVPWKSKSTGRLTDDSSGIFVAESGVATHVGNFTSTGTPDPVTGKTWLELTAANGDKLFGYVAGQSGTLPVIQNSVIIYDGTGRFKGVTGSYVGTLTVDMKTFTFQATATGTLSKK